MPEKPEVITVSKALEKRLINRSITSCNVYWDNIIIGDSKEFSKRIIGQTISSITTRGKWLVIFLTKDALLIHLRMEGKFTFREIGTKKEKHEHVIIDLDNNTDFRFHDVRKFGKMMLVPKDEVFNLKPLADLGLEYNDKNLTKEYLYNKINSKKLPIKTVLLDQSIISGLGNIYDDEVLFMSRINPLRKASNIKIEECDDIIKNSKIVLEKAIKLGGTTIKSFTSSEGVHGLFQNELLVHQKENEPCPNCKEKIVKTKVGGRGTYYCPKCQKS